MPSLSGREVHHWAEQPMIEIQSEADIRCIAKRTLTAEVS
jgi:hypothetical protein